jgi:gliding motility-associatede transport system auxiliary component
MNKYLQKLDTLGLLLLIGAAIWYSISNVWDKRILSLAIIGGALVVIGIAANYKQILSTLGKRSTKYAGNYVVSVVLVAALVSGVNYIGQRHPKRFDLTAVGRYTLASQTTQVLGKLNKDIDIKAFFPGGDYAPLRELLTTYRTQSRHIRFEFIDPDKHPDVAKQFEVTTYGTFQNPLTGTSLKFGTVVLLYGDRKEKIEKRSEDVREEDLTNAIIKVGRTEAKKIYFVQGHGEKDTAAADEKAGYSLVKKALEDQGYVVDNVNLASEGKVPLDAKVLIEAGPEKEPFPQEVQFISDFLNKGGSLLLEVDPSPAASFESFLKGWGVKVDNDIVLDVSGVGRLMGAGPTIPLVLKYETHKITDRFRAMTFFPLIRSVGPAKDSISGITVETLFKSNDNSWGETDLKNNNASFDEKTDFKGPLSLAVAVTKEIKPAGDNAAAARARMVVVGDSDFAGNSYFADQGNGNLFLNMVSWLAQDEDLISIRPKAPEDRRIILSQSQIATLRLLTIFLLPGTVLFIGIAVWTRRRR